MKLLDGAVHVVNVVIQIDHDDVDVPIRDVRILAIAQHGNGRNVVIHEQLRESVAENDLIFDDEQPYHNTLLRNGLRHRSWLTRAAGHFQEGYDVKGFGQNIERLFDELDLGCGG